MKPFSDNIIFFDTEFSSNDPNKGEILSLAMLKLNGEELYLELEYSGKVSEWVKEHILHTLTGEKVSKEVAAEKIKSFLGDTKLYLVTYVNQFDFVYLFKIFPYSDTLVESTPVDFASILFWNGNRSE